MGFASLIEIAVVTLYLAGSAFYPAGMLGQKPYLRRIAGICTGGGFALHTLRLILAFAADKHAVFYQGELYLSLMAWLMLVVFFYGWWKKRLEFLALAASPLALVAYLSSLTLPESVVKMPQKLSALFFTLHIGSLFISISLLAMASMAGVFFLHIDRKIKLKEKLEGFRKDLPSLNAFDLANKWAVLWGFPLYSVGLLTGFVWGRFTWGKLLTWDPKEIISLCIWGVFAFLFHQRLTAGWRGKVAAQFAIAVFVFSILSLVGVNFLAESHHNF